MSLNMNIVAGGGADDWCSLCPSTTAFNGLVPKYISALLTWYVPSWPLRSVDGALLVTPRSRLVTKGDWAFAIKALTLWNSLPAELRHTDLLTSLKSLLKTFLFVKAFGNVWYTFFLIIWSYSFFCLYFYLLCLFSFSFCKALCNIVKKSAI